MPRAIIATVFYIIIFTLVNIALIRIKRTAPHPEGIKTYPVIIPIIAIVMNLLLLTFQLVSLF